MSTLPTRVLVAYATKNGSTREVADLIGTLAHDAGRPIEVVPAHAVAGRLHGYGLIVLGAPLYSGRWHRDARRFLKRHRTDLGTVPVAVFALGPRRDDEEAWHRSWEQLHRALAAVPWLTPVAVGLFGGADPRRRGRSERRDLRDWAAIGEWTRTLLDRSPASPQAETTGQ
ncbi:hypothetical protein JIG36_12185 [Actinoplanes sp. LDG1-06]|uniref:Flavodoxin-like domain-containing protein n=1 Tax=Paractinoplanes ovalisporus TaxID=2810368 RepID=A0ABS2A907_9ACTN|nr:flavodoxin domain-containing protein [Actinoplanes ovalisporus]MBM2616315.1 hypothetical protein [Actinoplanes ovalisporus]